MKEYDYNKKYELTCHIMHYKPAQIFRIIATGDMVNEIIYQLKNNNILVDHINEIN